MRARTRQRLPVNPGTGKPGAGKPHNGQVGPIVDGGASWSYEVTTLCTVEYSIRGIAK
jgi:hypothetical protein